MCHAIVLGCSTYVYLVMDYRTAVSYLVLVSLSGLADMLLRWFLFTFLLHPLLLRIRNWPEYRLELLLEASFLILCLYSCQPFEFLEILERGEVVVYLNRHLPRLYASPQPLSFRHTKPVDGVRLYPQSP